MRLDLVACWIDTDRAWYPEAVHVALSATERKTLAGALQQLAKRSSPATVETAIAAYFSDRNDYLCERKHPIELFSKYFRRWVNPHRPVPALSAAYYARAHAWADACEHDPPCLTAHEHHSRAHGGGMEDYYRRARHRSQEDEC